MIENIKFICLDLWGTLFIESKKYKKQLNDIKCEIISNNFTECSKKDISKAIRYDQNQARKESSCGYNLSYVKRIERILNFLKIKTTESHCKKIYNNIELEISKIYPEINNELLEHIKNLKNNIILCSNSGFTSSKVIKKLLYELGLNKLFYKTYFSDELGITKSNPNFYKTVIKNECETAENFLVVGDNILYDVEIPKKLRMNSLIVGSFLDKLNKKLVEENYLKNGNYKLLSVVVHKNLVYLNEDTKTIIKFFKRFPNGQHRYKRELEFQKLALQNSIKIPKILRTEKYKNDIIFASIEYEYFNIKSAKEILKNSYKTMSEKDFIKLLKEYCFKIFNLLKSYFYINSKIINSKFSKFDRSIYMYKTALLVYYNKLVKLVPNIRENLDVLMQEYAKLNNSTCDITIGLTNGDFSLRDVLINENETLAIDWEHYRYAPAESDIAGILCSLFNAFYKIEKIDEILIKIIKEFFPDLNFKLLAYFCINRFITVACTDYKIIQQENYDFYFNFFKKILGDYYETI